MKPFTKSVIWTWGWAIIMPFLIAFVIQLPLCKIQFLSDFFEQQKKIHVYQFLSVVFILPSFFIILWQFKTIKQRIFNSLLYTASLIAILPAVWILYVATII